MVTSYWKTLKTVENLADKPHLTLAKLSKTVNSFLGCEQIGQTFKNLQKNILFKKLFLGASLHQFARKKRLLLNLV
jgi:hypothetical protein